GDLLNLHSFPTRRSSDLQSGYTKSDSNQTDEKVENNEVVGIDRVMQFVSLKQSILQTKLPALQLATEEEPEEDEEKDMMELEDEDRKSTRLNSSHVSISY